MMEEIGTISNDIKIEITGPLEALVFHSNSDSIIVRNTHLKNLQRAIKIFLMDPYQMENSILINSEEKIWVHLSEEAFTLMGNNSLIVMKESDLYAISCVLFDVFKQCSGFIQEDLCLINNLITLSVLSETSESCLKTLLSDTDVLDVVLDSCDSSKCRQETCKLFKDNAQFILFLIFAGKIRKGFCKKT